MTLIVIKLGDKVYNGDKKEEGYDLLRFLNLIMYPHDNDFIANVSEYIDYSDNEELWKEVTDVSTIEQIKYQGMMEELTEKLTEELTEEIAEKLTEELTEEITEKLTEEITKDVTEEITKDITEQVTKEGIRILIQSNREDGISEERTIVKLQRHFNITKEKATQYYREFTEEI